MDFIEFEDYKGKVILIEVSRITHLSSDKGDERLYTSFMPYIELKAGEFNRLKNELESRSKSQQSSNDSLSKLLEKGIAIRVPGPRYGL